MARNSTVGHFSWPLAEHYFGCDEWLAPLAHSGAWYPQRATRAKASAQFASQRTPALNVERLVNGFVRDAHGRIIGEVKQQPATDLLRAPTCAQASVCPSAVASPFARHVGPQDRFALGIEDRPREPLLHVGLQLFVMHKLGCFWAFGRFLGLPLSNRRPIL